MMNKKKIYTVIICASVVVLLLVAIAVILLKKNHTATGSGTDSNSIVIEATDIKIVDKEETPFVVVVPNNAEKYTEFAAEEFVKLFYEATGIKLNYIPESELGDRTEYIFSIGKTNLAKDNNVIGDTSKLKMCGSRLVTKDTNLYLFGATMYGDVHAVYDFMEYTFNYKFYELDEYYIEKNTDAYLLDFDQTNIPDIDTLCMMDGKMFATPYGYQHYRAVDYYEWWIAGLFAHNYLKIVPPEIYQQEHPEWFTEKVEDGGLCLTNQEMKAEFIKRVCQILEENPSRNLMMLGQEDGFGFCPCDNCKNRMDELGGFESAVMMEFTNDVVRACNEWLAEHQPDRDVTFVTFAYNATKKPPAVYDKAEGTYKPVSDTVIAEDNLSVMYVINFVDYLVPYHENPAQVSMMGGWNAVCNNITIWNYYNNFSDYMQPFCNFGTIAANYKWLYENNVTMITDQGPHNTTIATCFREMKLYMMSELSRDTSLDPTVLVDEFMKAYYKDCADEMKKVYDLLNNHYMMLQQEKGITLLSNQTDVMTSQNWSYIFLDTMNSIVEDALKELEPLKETDPEQYEIMYKRVHREGLWIRYYTYKLHSTSLQDAEEYWSVLRRDLESYGMTKFSE